MASIGTRSGATGNGIKYILTIATNQGKGGQSHR